MSVLLWGLRRDTPLAAVDRELRRMGVATHLLDQREVLGTSVERGRGPAPLERVRCGAREVDLSRVSAAYLRPHDSSRLPSLRALPATAPQRLHAAAVDAALYDWANRCAAFVVNRPDASASNGSKPYQLRAVAAAGFLVPPTLVTNDPEDAAAFRRRYDAVVVKSVSGIRSQVRVVGAADLDRLRDVRTCPTQFQARIPGTDVRVHVVGGTVFATEVASEADDYRYARNEGLPEPELAATELPERVALRCRELARRLALPVAGIDLRRAPDGEWYCFEVNPSPAFSYYEAATGQPIAAAVAALLLAAVVCDRRHDRRRTG